MDWGLFSQTATWVVIVFIGGFIATFGKHLGKKVISLLGGTSGKTPTPPAGDAPHTPPQQEPDYTLEKKRLKLEKKRLKEDAKAKKKENPRHAT